MTTNAAVVRDARLDDERDVAALFHTAGWGQPSFEGWRRQNRDTPVAAGRPDTGFGWVLESEGRAVGFLRNVVQGYRYGDRSLIAAAASTLIVEPDYRGYTLRLVAAFCKQRGVDLLLNTTAAPETAKIFEFLKFSRMPQPEYDLSLFWVLHARGFLAPALRKKGVPHAAVAAGSVALAPALSMFLHMTGRRIACRETSCEVTVINTAQIDERFDDLWARKLGEGKRLLACRDARTLRWHFPPTEAVPPPRVICAVGKGRLLGYLVVLRRDSAHIGLRRARVADIFVERDDEAVIRQLLCEAATQAVRDGAVMLEVVGMPRNVRHVLREFRPQTLPDRCWPFSYKTNDAELRADLAREDRWYAGPYDGDGTL
ncbi:MAG TPA: hypothetical protein VES67_16550 [Vicinamibacterales bacterium]|nr:hypothetical protein [Vicinamibacterales bacterium]